jgi:cytochrome P450
MGAASASEEQPQAGPLPLADAFNPFDLAFMADPGPVLELARRDEPVFFSPFVGAWVVTRYEDVDRILRDPERFPSKEILSIKDLLSPEVATYFGDRIPMEGTLIGVDAPQHTRLRRVLQKALTPGRITELEDGLRQIALNIVERLRPMGTADLLSELAYPLPLVTITRLIGIPDEEVPVFRQAAEDWAALSVAFIQGVAIEEQMRLAEGIMAMHERVLALFGERRAEPKDDLLSALVAQQDSQRLSDYELLSLVPGLFLAGHETTANLLANALWHLLSERGAWEGFVNDPATVGNIVEEILRLDTSVLGMWRNVAQDCEISGVPIAAGQRVYLAFWSANRDESRYPGAAVFDPTRSGSAPHLAFGRGIHFCIGAQLARLELRTALTVLAESLPELRLADGFEPSYRPHFFLRGLDSLWARW